MGSWGTGAFDNDTACDWSNDLLDAEDLSFVQDTLSSVHELDDDELDADLGAEALAACEVVARLQGRAGRKDANTAIVDCWVRAHPVRPPAELVELATHVIDRVVQVSELAQRWQGDQTWRASMQDLRRRVAG
ncbi:MAG: DUF4259 domain-containing protein [Deltaproteobacteria bacterium]|nr:DUF4259 domain-containing protein [Deltaproteobacteria bacterium]